MSKNKILKVAIIGLIIGVMLALPSIKAESLMPEPRYKLTDEEMNMMMFIADREDNTDINSRLAIMQVIMNRVNSPKFPDNVYDVLYARGQFATIKKYYKDYIPSEDAWIAMDRLLYDEKNIFDGKEALFFAEKSVNKKRIACGLYLIATFGGTNFYGQK